MKSVNVDRQLVYGRTYYYAIAAVNSAGESDMSQTDYVTVPQYNYATCDAYYSDISCTGSSVNSPCGTASSCRATSTLPSGDAICRCTSDTGLQSRAP